MVHFWTTKAKSFSRKIKQVLSSYSSDSAWNFHTAWQLGIDWTSSWEYCHHSCVQEQFGIQPRTVIQMGSSINFGKRLHRNTIRRESWKKTDQGPFHQVCHSSLHRFCSRKEGQKLLHLSQRQGRDLHDWTGWTTARVEGEGGWTKYLRNTENDPWKNKEECEHGGILIRKGRVMLISILFKLYSFVSS